MCHSCTNDRENGSRQTKGIPALLLLNVCALGRDNLVYISAGEDNAVKEYLLLWDDNKLVLKKQKRQIFALALRRGYQYTGTKWTDMHIFWLRKLELNPIYQETLREYLASYDEQGAKIERFNKLVIKKV